MSISFFAGTVFYTCGVPASSETEAKIPAFGVGRQYFSVTPQEESLEYAFQVYRGDELIRETVQNTAELRLEEPLPAESDPDTPLHYFWRVCLIDGTGERSPWRGLFPFRVNLPPSRPEGLTARKK